MDGSFRPVHETFLLSKITRHLPPPLAYNTSDFVPTTEMVKEGSSSLSPYRDHQDRSSTTSSPSLERRRINARRRMPLWISLYMIIFAFFVFEVILYKWLANNNPDDLSMDVYPGEFVIDDSSRATISEQEYGVTVKMDEQTNDIAINTGGSELIERMYHRIESLHQACKSAFYVYNATASKSFKILEDLKHINRSHPDDNNIYGASKGSDNDPRKSAPTSCLAPPVNSCSSTQYSVVITYHIHEHKNIPTAQLHRTLFLNIVSLMSSNESKSNIIILAHGDENAIESMKHEHDYGRRIWNWHKKEVIQFISHVHGHEDESGDGSHDHDHNHDDDLFFAYRPEVLEYVTNDIILFLDGLQPIVKSEDNRGGIESFNAGFELIRADSKLLVGNQVTSWKDIHTTIMDYGQGVSDNTNPFAPFCDDGTETIEIESIHASGMFLHKNYLCLLWDDLFAPLRGLAREVSQRYNNDEAIDSDLASLVVSTLVVQLGGSIPLTYPMLRQTWDETNADKVHQQPSRRLSEVHIEQKWNGLYQYNSGRRRRTNWDEFIEESGTMRRKLHTPLSDIEKSGVSQGGDSPTIKQLKPEDARSIVQYFGSYSRGQRCWCKGASYEESRNTNCHVTCEETIGRVPTIKDLPWMNDEKDRRRCLY